MLSVEDKILIDQKPVGMWVSAKRGHLEHNL